MAKIIIRRKTQLNGGACNFDVYLKNTYVGKLKNGGSLELTTGVGKQLLFFKPKIRLGKTPDTLFEAVVNEETEVVELKAKFNMSGCFSVEYADNAPHIPTYNDSKEEYDEMFVPNSKSEINKSLAEIKKETKKTNGCLNGCLGGLIAFIAFIIVIRLIVSALIFNDKPSSTTPTSIGQTSNETDSQEKSKNTGDKTDSQEKDENTDKDVLYCDDNFKITYISLVDPHTGLTMYNMNLKLENNSNKNVSIYLSDAYVNDIAIEFLGGNSSFDGTAPGKKSICAFMFGHANHGLESIDDIKKMEFKITLRNSDQFSDVLLSTDTITMNFD